MQFPEMRGAHLIAGALGLDREVSFAHVVEEPDVEAWIQPGLLVLTTGQHFQHATIGREWLKELDEHHAAGLIVACGRHLQAIPQSMEEEANRRAFPLIEVPWDVPFITITTAVYRKSTEAQVNALEHLADVQTQVSQAALSARSIQDLMQKFSSILERPVRILTHKEPTQGRTFPVPNPTSDLSLVSLGPEPLDAIHMQVGRQIAIITGLFMLREQVARQSEWDARSHFITQILSGIQPSEPYLGWDSYEPWSFMPTHSHYLIALTLPDPVRKGTSVPNPQLSKFRQVTWGLLDPLRTFLTVIHPENILIAVVDAERVEDQEVLMRIQDLLIQFPDESAAMADPVPVERIPATYQNLLKLLVFAPAGKITRTRTMVYPRLIASLPREPMEMLLSETWDRIPDPKLRHTLTVWIDAGGSTQEVLRRLGTHRNTLNNRLKQIEKLLGTPLTPQVVNQLKLGHDWLSANPGYAAFSER